MFNRNAMRIEFQFATDDRALVFRRGRRPGCWWPRANPVYIARMFLKHSMIAVIILLVAMFFAPMLSHGHPDQEPQSPFPRCVAKTHPGVGHNPARLMHYRRTATVRQMLHHLQGRSPADL